MIFRVRLLLFSCYLLIVCLRMFLTGASDIGSFPPQTADNDDFENQSSLTTSIANGSSPDDIQQKDNSLTILLYDEQLHETIEVDAMSEGPFTFNISVNTTENVSLHFRPTDGAPSPRYGNWTIDDRTGVIRYWPYKDAFGSDALHFTVSTTDDPPSTIQSVFNITLHYISILPSVFLATHNHNLMDNTQGLVELLMEQRTGRNEAYADLLLTLGAYDVDVDDVLSMRVTQPPRHGQLHISRANRNTLSHPNCDINLTMLDYRTWEPFIPCDIIVPRSPELLSWLSALLMYQPNLGFYGVDKFRLHVTEARSNRSQTGGDSPAVDRRKVITVILYVVRNPCINGGRCAGKTSLDPHCVSPRRVINFDHYKCVCPAEWTGEYCQYSSDPCHYHPCRPPWLCLQEHATYRCECPSGVMACREPWSRWKMACITAGVGVFIAGITVVIIILARRRIDSSAGFLRRQ